MKIYIKLKMNYFCIYTFLVIFASLSAAVEPSSDLSNPREVNLGTAINYAILAKSGISSVPKSVITGDIGVSPIAATAMTGFSLTLDSTAQFSTSTQIIGHAVAASYGGPVAVTLTTAISDVELAYTDATGRVNVDNSRKNINGGILGVGGLHGGSNAPMTSGIYTFTTDISINSDITFRGGRNAVVIIQTTGNVFMAQGKKVILAGGILPQNIVWQVAGAVFVETSAHMEGILLVKTDVTFETGASLIGRILTQTACNLQMTTVTPPI